MESAILEDVQVNNNAMASLASALASAAASERDNRQRKNLVESMVCALFDTLGSSTNTKSTNEESSQLIQQILGDEKTGTTTIANSFSMITPLLKITLNQKNPLNIHWSWQTTKDSGGNIDSSTCYISLFAKEGASIEFFPPPATPAAATTQTEDEGLAIAICEVSNFQWTLEGTIKKQKTQSIQTFWKFPTASFSWISGHLGGIPTEEILLEGKDGSLTGNIANENSENGALQLQPKAILDIKLSSVESLGMSDKEVRKVGIALRSFVNFLERIISVPDLHLSLTDLSNAGDQDSQDSETQQDRSIPSFDEDGEKSLGGAMKYYLKYYCNGNNQKRASNILQPAKLFSTVDFASLKESVAHRTTAGTTYFAENKEKYAAAAGEAAGAAAIAGKQIADRGGALVGSFWTSVSQARNQQNASENQPEDATASTDTAEGTSVGGFSFGNSFRNAVARGKEATGRMVSQQGEGSRFGGGFPTGMFASMHVGNAAPTPQTEPAQTQDEQA